MPVENLIHQEFGYLKVLSRAQDRITPSGQKRTFWKCRCLLCGTEKDISALDLKRGTAISCGCYNKRVGNKKICVICGTEFPCPPSSKKVTCSKACQREYARKRQLGKQFTEETREKMSATAKQRDMTDLQVMGREAAKISPKSGRYETNTKAIDWHLISPEGKHYYFHSLNFWLREHCRQFFNCEPDSHQFKNVASGLTGAKRAMLGKDYPCCTYKGWQVIPTEADRQN